MTSPSRQARPSKQPNHKPQNQNRTTPNTTNTKQTKQKQKRQQNRPKRKATNKPNRSKKGNKTDPKEKPRTKTILKKCFPARDPKQCSVNFLGYKAVVLCKGSAPRHSVLNLDAAGPLLRDLCLDSRSLHQDSFGAESENVDFQNERFTRDIWKKRE